MTEEMQGMIVVETLPQITESLENLIVPVRERVCELMTMECTEENKQECKARRTEVRKAKEDLLFAVKKVKERILEPFLSVEEKAEMICAEFDKADVSLKGKVAQIEDEQKHRKEDAVKAFFLELRESMNIGEWLSFEDMNLKITLSDSEKSLMSVVESFLEKVSEDMNVISRLPDSDEVMAEFRSSLNLNSAIKTVEARKAQIERIKADAERMGKALAEEKERKEAVHKVVQAYEAVSAPVASEMEEKVSEKRYRASFTVVGTKEEIVSVKKFLEERGITYES